MTDPRHSAVATDRRNGLSKFAAGLNPRKTALLAEHGCGTSLLDVGCGNGLYPLTSGGRFGRILQIDIADRRAPEAYELPFQQMDAANVASLEQRFDTVLCFDIIEHLDDDNAFVRDIRGLCSGCLIGSVPADDDTQLRRIGLTHVHHVDKTHRREYSRDSLLALLTRAGFTDVVVLPQWNEGLVLSPYALRTESLASRFCAKVLIVCNRALCNLGVFRNDSVADWLFVAR